MTQNEIFGEIEQISTRLTELFSPVKIITFGEKKHSGTNKVTDIDICVIADFKDKREAMRAAYRGIISDFPFDLYFYDISEWNKLKDEEGTFAERINRKGRVVYESSKDNA